MPRAVSPWTWRIALRDHGPDDQSILLTLFVLSTFMNRDGTCFPSQPTIAKGARVSERTVRRHLIEAQRQGWLGLEHLNTGGQGWRKNLYRCAVPDDVELSEKDDRISDSIEAADGEITSRHADTKMSGRNRQAGREFVKRMARERVRAADTQMSGRPIVQRSAEGPSKGVTCGQMTHERADKPLPSSGQNQAERADTHVLLTPGLTLDPNSSVLTHTEARAGAQADGCEKSAESEGDRIERQERERQTTERELERKALRLIQASPGTSNAQLHQLYGLTPERAADLRKEATEQKSASG